ncbi:MAG: hypothetical protein WD379_00785 [Dehalococcoidia bacterium]
MSKLSEKIRRAGQVESAPLGFGLGRPREAPASMLCLLRLDKEQSKKPEAADADAVILEGVAADRAGSVAKKLGDTLLGLRLEGGDRAAVAAARGAAADFVVLDAASPAEALLESGGVGLVLVADEWGDPELRTLAGLGLDAIVVGQMEEPFTLGRLLELRRLAVLSQTPLLVEVDPKIEASRLETLRESGVLGVILDGKSAAKLPALRKLVLSLPQRGKRKSEHSDALLPSLVGAGDYEEDDDDE